MPTNMQNAYVPGVPTVNIREFAQRVKKAYLRGNESGKYLVLACYSKPGIGKSVVLKQLADSLGISYLNKRFSLIPPMDVQGNPYNKEHETGEVRQTYSTPNCLPSLSIDGDTGIFVVDEMNMANNTILGMMQQLLDSRRIGDYVIPEKWIIVACMNLRAHGAHVNELSTPNNNRLIHYNIKEDVDIWIEDFASRPQNDIHPMIIAYLKEYPNHFYVMPKAGEKAYPTPRTWEKVSEMIHAGLEDDIEAAIGSAVGQSFKQFYELKDQLPSWSRIIAGDKAYIDGWSYYSSCTANC